MVLTEPSFELAIADIGLVRTSSRARGAEKGKYQTYRNK